MHFSLILFPILPVSFLDGFHSLINSTNFNWNFFPVFSCDKKIFQVMFFRPSGKRAVFGNLDIYFPLK